MKTLSKIQVALFTIIFLGTIPISSYGTDGQRKLTQPVPPATFPIVINQPGSYVLTSNLVVEDPNQNAIEITINDVTLDLNGHTIQGPNTGSGNGCGVYGYDRYSITIKNGRVWGFRGLGINLNAAPEHFSREGGGHMIQDIQAMNNAGGIRIWGGGVITNCIANNNGSTGILALNSTVTHCTTNKNTEYGIEASFSTISHCTASFNGIIGINASGTTVVQCTADFNVTAGITASSSLIRDCNIYYNSTGIQSANMSSIVGNNLSNNINYGLSLSTGGLDYAIKNVVNGSTTPYFSGSASNYMPICGVDATDNCNYSF